MPSPGKAADIFTRRRFVLGNERGGFTDFEVALADVKHDLRGMAYKYRYRCELKRLFGR